MKILDREISKKSESAYIALTNGLSKPLCFSEIKKGISAFGQCDINNPTSYLIYLNAELPQDIFEVNALHEIAHAAQDNRGYPYLRVNPILEKSIRREHIESLQHEIQSRILDIFVINDLKKLGISSEYFISYGFSRIMDAIHSGYRFEYIVDEIDFAMKLVYLSCVCGAARTDQLKHKVKQFYPTMFNKAFSLAKRCKRIGFNSARDAALVEIECFNTYGIWRCLHIASARGTITSPDDTEKFLSLF